MHNFVIDANIIISILISGKSSYKPLLSYYNFITSEYALTEIEKYRSVIFERTKLQPDELRQFTYFFFSHIAVIPRLVFTETALTKATELTINVDIKDISYIALSMQFDYVLLTKDKVLFTGVKKQGFRKIMLFDDFLRKI